MKINYKKLFEDRILEIDYKIKIAIARKDWVRKQKLIEEKKELLIKIESIDKGK